MSVKLEQIVPFGRSRLEYQLMFNLSEEDCKKKILGCGDGPASFNAEMTAEGYSVISIDPIYQFSGTEIKQRFAEVIDEIIAQVKATPNNWTWTYHRDPEDLRNHRTQALETFLADYHNDSQQRYQIAALPNLPFVDGEFELALCSHLLFLYSDLLSAEFHLQSIRELCRVATEVRIFPLLTLARQISPYLQFVLDKITELGIKNRIETVKYELQKGGNQMLRLWR